MRRQAWIVGPCAAESIQQLWDTARAVCRFPEVELVRCGVWKARSQPSDFEGMGEAALPVLEQIQKELHLPVCVEIAYPWQLDKILEHGISHAWIGARTTVNPFMVQALADAARGTGLHLMLKNPLAPDLKLWEGAFNRFRAAGLRDLKAVYRGFATSLPTVYRNHPMWNEYIRWKSQHPDIPLYVDPSHIAGRRNLILEVAEKALLLDCDGLMLEVHTNPAEALSDAGQQLSPEALAELMAHLPLQGSRSLDDALVAQRAAIDALDTDLLAILSKRMEVVRKIARIKQDGRQPLLQVERWQKVMEQVLQQAEKLHLPADFVTELMQLVHAASIEEQERELKKSHSPQ